MSKELVVIETMVNAPVEIVWEKWNAPAHITEWYTATPGWHTPQASADFTEGGSFNYRMEAKDGSFGFDFNGTFDEIVENEFIAYTLADGSEVKITFSSLGPNTHIEQEFEAEGENPVEMQKAGWQAILDNFKSYIEGSDEEE